MPVLRRTAGLVTAYVAKDSDSRLLAVELGIPAVVGTLMGMDTLRAGMQVALDARRDVIYDQPGALIYIGE